MGVIFPRFVVIASNHQPDPTPDSNFPANLVVWQGAGWGEGIGGFGCFSAL